MCDHHHETTPSVDKELSEMLNRRKMIQALAAGGSVAVAGGLTGCATNPDTGDSQLLLVGESALNQQAASSWAEAKSKQKTTTDPRYLGRLKNVGRRIARGARRDKQSWDYAVLDSDTKNAFVLPGNRVGFYKGMMDFTDNDDQVAAIMGHEVGHVAGKHAAARMSQNMIGQGAVMGATILGGAQMQKKCKQATSRQEYNQCMRGANRNTQMLNQALGLGFMVGIALPFSRKHESQSDLLGARYMQRAGYNPYEAVRLWEKMAESSTRRQPEFLSTHPDPSRRARDLHNYIKCQERAGSQGWGDQNLKAALKACKA